MNNNLNKLHAIQLEILRKFTNFCEEYNIKYCLCGGTLLGAVRHQGFIPWDDDIDIFVSRPDFEKLRQLAAQPIDQHIKISCFQNGGVFPFIKIYDTRYRVHEGDKHQKVETYAWVDVFPLDGLPEDVSATKRAYKKARRLRFIISHRTMAISSILHTGTIPKRLLKVPVKLLINLFPVSFYCRRLNRLAQIYDYSSSKYIGNLCWGYGPREKIPKAFFENRELVRFEGHEFYALSHQNEYLQQIYGDYMRLPPKSERRSHNIQFIN